MCKSLNFSSWWRRRWRIHWRRFLVVIATTKTALQKNNCGALGHHLRGGQKCVQSVHLLWLTQSQNCSAAPRQLGALKYGAQLPTIVALVYCNCWPMVSMSGPWTSYLGFSIESWLFKKSWHLVFGRTVKYESEGHDLVICKSPVTRNVIWNQATSRQLSPQKARELSLGLRLSALSPIKVLFSCYKEELCSRLKTWQPF